MAIRLLSNQTIDSTLDLTGRVKVSGSSADQYFYEGARAGVGVTFSLYDNANNIYFNGYSGIVLRANQLGGSGGSIVLSGGNVGLGIVPAASVALDVKESDTSDDLILGLTAGTGARAQIRSVVQSADTESVLSFHTTLSSSTQERLRILATGALSLGNSGTNYGTAGQVLTSSGNSVPNWSTPTTGTITGSGTANKVTKFTGATAIGDGPITFATNDSTFAGNVTASGDIQADQFISTNNGNGQNYRIGDDAWIGDINIANTFRIQGNQNANNGYITFGNSSNDALGRAGTGPLTWGSSFKIADEKILGLRITTNEYAIQYRDLDFRFIGAADGTTQRKFSFGHYTSDNPAGTWNGKVYINSYTGEVGIGTASPQSKLHVGSTGTNAYSTTITKGSNMKGIINTLSNNADDMVGIYFATGTTTEGTHWSGITGSRTDNSSHWGTQLNFYTHANDVAAINDATQKMVIKGDGNVGIGTSSPSGKLDVQSSGSWGLYGRGSGGDINVENTNTSVNEGGWIGISGYTGNTANSGFYPMAGITAKKSTASGDGNYGGDLSFWTTAGTGQSGEANSGMYQRMTINRFGNVGIGTDSPTQKLHVEGLALIKNNTSGLLYLYDTSNSIYGDINGCLLYTSPSPRD